MVLEDIKSRESYKERNNDDEHGELRGFTPEELDQRQMALRVINKFLSVFPVKRRCPL